MISDAACKALYPVGGGGDLTVGGDQERPFKCFSSATAAPAPIDADLKKVAIMYCPKTCGYCCETSAYSCENPPCKFKTKKQRFDS